MKIEEGDLQILTSHLKILANYLQAVGTDLKTFSKSRRVNIWNLTS